MRDASSERLFAFDHEERPSAQGLMAGIDEAGRGPLAGPVVASAVLFFRKPFPLLSGLNDSKKVAPKRREILFGEIFRHALVGIGVVEESEIDRINIFQATRAAMKKAVLALPRTPDLLLIDGKIHLDLPIAQKSIVRGDEKSASIAAASIVAKVYRDAWMQRLDTLYPVYGFKRHKGYGTEFHLQKIREIGPSPVHRKSFSPVGAWKKDA